MHKWVVLHVYSSMYKPSLATGLTGKSLLTPTHPKGPELNGNCFIAESHPLVINTLANRHVHEFRLLPPWSPIPVVKVSAWFPCQTFTDTGGQVDLSAGNVLILEWVTAWEYTFSQMLESDHGWIAVCTNEWCYTYILLSWETVGMELTASQLDPNLSHSKPQFTILFC